MVQMVILTYEIRPLALTPLMDEIKFESDLVYRWRLTQYKIWFLNGK